MDKKHLFYLGGFVSIASYLTMIASLWIILAKPFIPKKQSFPQASALTVTLQDAQIPHASEKQASPTETAQTKKIVEPRAVTEKIEAKHSAKAQKEHATPVADKSKATHAPQKESSSEDNTVQYQQPQRASAKSVLQSLSVSKVQSSAKISLVGKDISDEYFAKIAQIVQSGWAPIASDIGMQAVVFVSIEPNGSFVWKIKTASPSSDFNRRLAEYFRFLQSQSFPSTKEGRSVSAEFIFKAKE